MKLDTVDHLEFTLPCLEKVPAGPAISVRSPRWRSRTVAVPLAWLQLASKPTLSVRKTGVASDESPHDTSSHIKAVEGIGPQGLRNSPTRQCPAVYFSIAAAAMFSKVAFPRIQLLLRPSYRWVMSAR